MWSKETVELLINKYEKHENLYNLSHPHYVDRVKRSNSLFAICKDLKEINKNITVEDIKKKIHTLRSQYLKEVRELAESKKSGFEEDVYEPKLWCFSKLAFLRRHCSTRKLIESNISGSSNDSIKSLPKRRKVVEEREEIADVTDVTDVADVVYDTFEESGNDLSVLAQGWSSQYAELSRQQRVFARKIISDVLFHGCLDNLRESTVREIHNIFEAVAEKIYDPFHSDE